MEKAEEKLAREISERLKELGTNAFAIEKAAGLPADAVRSILRGVKKSGTTINGAQEVCRALGLELYIGPKREEGPVASMTVDGTNYVHVPLHDAMLAAGSGSCNDAEPVIEQLAFRKDWLRRNGVTASSARLARVQGDSMQPTLWHGDMVLIDTASAPPMVRPKSAKDLRRPPIYALLDDGEARIKRVERPTPDLTLLISDNPDFSPDPRQGDAQAGLRIIGKVVWWGHTVRD